MPYFGGAAACSAAGRLPLRGRRRLTVVKLAVGQFAAWLPAGLLAHWSVGVGKPTPSKKCLGQFSAFKRKFNLSYRFKQKLLGFV